MLIQVSTISSAYANQLTIDPGTKSAETDGEDGLGAPVTVGIAETLKDLMDRSEAQLEDVRKTEVANLHNYQTLKQSLVEEVKCKQGKGGSKGCICRIWKSER